MLLSKIWPIYRLILIEINMKAFIKLCSSFIISITMKKKV